MIREARKILKSVFGYDRFISLQQDIIGNVLGGRDALAVMPTGGGKSLCYQPCLTVSISEPFEGSCYKLVAGVIV